MALLQFLNEVKAFHVRHKLVAQMIWSFVGIVFAVLSILLDHAAAAMFSMLIAALGFGVLMRYSNALESRINAGSTAPVWTVQVNDVTVGTIKDSDYAALRRAVFLDFRTYTKQLLNLGNMAIRLVDYWFVSIPIGAFWLSISCFFFSPETFTEFVGALQKITLGQVVAASPVLSQMFVLASIIVLAMHAVLNRRFGFVNCFDQECNARLRRALYCVAEGDVSLFRVEDTGRFKCDERDCIRPSKNDGAAT